MNGKAIGRDHLAILIGAGSPGCESFLGGVGGEKDSDARETHGNIPCGLGREPLNLVLSNLIQFEHGPNGTLCFGIWDPSMKLPFPGSEIWSLVK